MAGGEEDESVVSVGPVVHYVFVAHKHKLVYVWHSYLTIGFHDLGHACALGKGIAILHVIRCYHSVGYLSNKSERVATWSCGLRFYTKLKFFFYYFVLQTLADFKGAAEKELQLAWTF